MAEVRKAMDAGISILLVHEMIGVGGQEDRFGCEFGDFFRSEPDGTPGDLLQRGICAESPHTCPDPERVRSPAHIAAPRALAVQASTRPSPSR